MPKQPVACPFQGDVHNGKTCTMFQMWEVSGGLMDDTQPVSLTNPPRNGLPSSQRQSFNIHWKAFNHPQNDKPRILGPQKMGRKPNQDVDTEAGTAIECKRQNKTQRVSCTDSKPINVMTE